MKKSFSRLGLSLVFFIISLFFNAFTIFFAWNNVLSVTLHLPQLSFVACLGIDFLFSTLVAHINKQEMSKDYKDGVVESQGYTPDVNVLFMFIYGCIVNLFAILVFWILSFFV